MTVNHKNFGKVEIVGQNDTKVYIVTTDGMEKSVFKFNYNQMLKNENGTEIDLSLVPFQQEADRVVFSKGGSDKKESKLAEMFNSAHIDEKYNILTKQFEKY